ncbi:efflux RND transporter periplasmic adaptor subunit, partial [Bosea thiooxidans]
MPARRHLLISCCLLGLVAPALAQAQAPGGAPPAVGVISVVPTEIAETTEFNGRIEAVDRVNIVAR